MPCAQLPSTAQNQSLFFVGEDAPDDAVDVVRMQSDRDPEFAHVTEKTLGQPTHTIDIVAQWLAGLRWAVKRAMRKNRSGGLDSHTVWRFSLSFGAPPFGETPDS